MVPHPAGGRFLFRYRPRSIYTSVGQNSPPGVVFCERSFSERSQGPVFASNSAMAVTHLAQTARMILKR